MKWAWGVIAALVASTAQAREVDHHTVTQYSTFSALAEGVYDGEMTVGELAHYGNFGIGTFNGLDGEMVAFGGHFYQASADGSVHEMKKDAKLPFATMSFFDPEEWLPLAEGIDWDDLVERIQDVNKEKLNLFYSVRVEGKFSYVKLRVPHAQSKPYPPIGEALAHQAIFELKDVEGTMVGFYSPNYVGAINVPGLHLHFISKDHKSGGHVLAFTAKSATAALHEQDRWLVEIPHNNAFQGAKLDKDYSAILKAAMKKNK